MIDTDRHISLTLDSKDLSVIDNVYDKICDYENLYQAHRYARKCKRYRMEIMVFTDNLETHLWALHRELIDETYNVGKYRQFYVHEPKTRLVMALAYRDRIVQWTIYRELNPFYDKQFIYDSYACRIGKGTHKAVKRLHYWLKQIDRKPGERWYYLKLDISKYFYRIDHGILINILAKRIKDKRLLELLIKIIDNKETRFGLPAGLSPNECTEEMWLFDVGMPIGNLTSQLFANIYLNELDQYCKHILHIHYYIRYMDDIIILLNDINELHEIKRKIEEFIENYLHLSLNDKTVIDRIDNGITFVGYRIWSTHIKLKKQGARRIIRHVKKLSEDLANGYMSIEEFKRVAASYNGVMLHCNSHGLRRELNSLFLDALQRQQEIKIEI